MTYMPSQEHDNICTVETWVEKRSTVQMYHSTIKLSAANHDGGGHSSGMLLNSFPQQFKSYVGVLTWTTCSGVLLLWKRRCGGSQTDTSPQYGGTLNMEVHSNLYH